MIHDLGGGSGAMGRWLAPRLPGPQRWVVHDRDADLLERAVAGPPPGVTVEARRSDITGLAPDDARRREPRDRLGAARPADRGRADAGCSRACAGRPLLLALTVVGRVALTPADPLDARVAAAFDAHQRRGGRLGPDAVAAAVDALRAAGAEASSGRARGASAPADAELAAEWLDGWVGAACEQEPGLAAAAGAYRDRRLAQAAAGELAVTVGHADLLVLP